MKRYTVKTIIEFTTNAQNPEKAQYNFIMHVINHLNITSDNEFIKADLNKLEITELPF